MELTKTKYKATEVGLIPEDWEVYQVIDLIELLTDYDANGSFSTVAENVKVYDFEKFAWYVRSTDLENNSKMSDVRYVDEESYKFLKKTALYGGELLFLKRGDIGNVYLFDMKTKYATVAPNLYLLKLNKTSNSTYLYYYFTSNQGQLQLKKKNASSTLGALYKDDVKSIYVPLPPTLTEQKAIATALSDVDELIANLDKLIEKKKAIKQGAMQELLTGKVRLKGFGENLGTKESETGLIPMDWDVKYLPEVFDYIHGKAHEQFIVKGGKYSVVNSKFVSTEGRVVKNSIENFCPARKGDILTVLSDLPNGRALAKTYFVEENEKYAVNQRICIWRSKKDNSLFLNYVMNRHKYFLKFDDGVTQTHILNHHIEKCPVLLPRNVAEQKAIGESIHDMDTEIDALEAKKAKYQDVKQGMMQELLTGKTRLV